MTFWFPSWRSHDPLKEHLNIPKKATKNCQVPDVSLNIKVEHHKLTRSHQQNAISTQFLWHHLIPSNRCTEDLPWESLTPFIFTNISPTKKNLWRIFNRSGKSEMRFFHVCQVQQSLRIFFERRSKDALTVGFSARKKKKCSYGDKKNEDFENFQGISGNTLVQFVKNRSCQLSQSDPRNVVPFAHLADLASKRSKLNLKRFESHKKKDPQFCRNPVIVN